MSCFWVIRINWTGFHDVLMLLQPFREAKLWKITNVRLRFRGLEWFWGPVLSFLIEFECVSVRIIYHYCLMKVKPIVYWLLKQNSIQNNSKFTLTSFLLWHLCWLVCRRGDCGPRKRAGTALCMTQAWTGFVSVRTWWATHGSSPNRRCICKNIISLYHFMDEQYMKKK